MFNSSHLSHHYRASSKQKLPTTHRAHSLALFLWPMKESEGIQVYACVRLSGDLDVLLVSFPALPHHAAVVLLKKHESLQEVKHECAIRKSEVGFCKVQHL